MPIDLFRRVAEAEGWSDATQLGILLRFIESRQDRLAFSAFLAQYRLVGPDSDADPADKFMWEVIEHLGNPGLAITAAFQQFCLNTHDLLTPRQAAERWCCWSLM